MEVEVVEELIVGLKQIAAFFGLKKVHTIREWEEKYHLPVRRDPSNRVYAIKSELVNWLIIYDRERRKNKTKQTPRGAVKIMMERKLTNLEKMIDG